MNPKATANEWDTLKLSFERGRVFFAVIPVLFMTVHWRESLILGAVTVLAFWATAFFFLFFSPWFPRKMTKIAMILWSAALAQGVAYFLHLTPLWVISMLLLLPDEIFKNPKRTVTGLRLLARGIFFAALILYLGLMNRILAERFLVWTFRLPVGAFILLAVASFLWQNQPGGSSREARAEEGGSDA